MRKIERSAGLGAAIAITVAAPTASALELSELASLLAGIPSSVLSYSGQGVDADGRVYIDDVRVNVPELGPVTADRVSVGDLDLIAMVSGHEPNFADVAIDGLTLSRNAWLAPFPWPFAADVLRGDIAFGVAVRDERPGSIEGRLDIDFGENGRVTGMIAMLEPAWYREDLRPGRDLPEVGRRVLLRQASLHVSGIAFSGDAIAALTEGLWPGGDTALALDFDYTASDDDSVSLSGGIESNLGRLAFSAQGLYGAQMRQEFNPDMRSAANAFDFIEWTIASISGEDDGFLDPALAIALAAATSKPAIVVLAEILGELSEVEEELEPGAARDGLRAVRGLLLNYGTYAGDRISLSIRPVAPISFSMLGDMRIDPRGGLHPDDLIGLLRLRYSYRSR